MGFVTISQERSEAVRKGYLWIFRRDIVKKRVGEEEFIVDVLDSSGRFLGKGIYNKKSKISVRLLTKGKERIDKNFFKKRISKANNFRRAVYPGLEMYRVVFSEGDMLPGLIIDRYGSFISTQILTMGMEKLWDFIRDSIFEVFNPDEIIKREDAPVRSQEGLPIKKQESEKIVEVEEFGIRYIVDVKKGHKTGFYLDQKDNRILLRNICEGKRVLDLFSYTGSWTLNALKGGASEVWCVEISKRLTEFIRENIKLNGFDINKVQIIKGDAFDKIKEIFSAGERFDIVINDPPAFAKRENDIDNAKRGYKYMNLYSFKLLRKGGFLFTFSCSQHFKRNLLSDVIKDAAQDAGVRFRILKELSQSMDHPINPFMEETFYLKGFLVSI